MIIKWNKGLFDYTIKLSNESGNIGFLRSNAWSTKYLGVLNEKKYIFKTKGVFNPIVIIIDPDTNKTIGNIRFNGLSSKAKINFHDAENATLFSKNIWQSKWRLSSEESYRVDYRGWQSKGHIKVSEEAPEALVLAGLMATNKIWDYSALVVIIITAIVSSS